MRMRMEKKEIPVTMHSPESLLDVKEMESKPIQIESEKWEKLKNEKGVKSIEIIGFSKMGPYLHSYTPSSNSSLLEKMKEDNSLVSEITIIGKHTSEFKTREGDKALIQPIGETGSYAIVEREGRKKREPRKLLHTIVKKIQKKDDKLLTLKQTIKNFAE